MAPVKRADIARSAFPPTLTASTWGDVLDAARKRAADKNGSTAGVPKLTNGEAVQLVRGFASALGRAAFPLWYQFGAVAYGWDPERDTLDASAGRALLPYPADVTAELWASLALLAASADADNATAGSLYLDSEWGDNTFVADIQQALHGDGAQAQFKIPLPACRDPKTGKPVGKPHWDSKRKRYVCDPVAVDDPITHGAKHVRIIAVAIGLLWLATRKKPRRRRRTR